MSSKPQPRPHERFTPFDRIKSNLIQNLKQLIDQQSVQSVPEIRCQVIGDPQ